MSQKNSKIPPIKSKSKIKPLKEKIQSLEYENNQLLEEMYSSGIRKRPTIMSQIEEREADLQRHIEFCISECEKETGRAFMFSIDFFHAKVA